MKDSVQLENEYEHLKGDPLAVVRFFEKNKDDIELLDESQMSVRHFKLTLYGDYGISLAVNGNIHKAIPVLEELIPAFEREAEKYDRELETSAYYEKMLWAFGCSLHEAKRYQEAQRIFDKLVKYYPDNTKYKKWFVTAKANRLSAARQSLWVACFAFIVIDFLFNKDMGEAMKNLFWITAVIILFVTLSLELYIYLIRKKYS